MSGDRDSPIWKQRYSQYLNGIDKLEIRQWTLNTELSLSASQKRLQPGTVKYLPGDLDVRISTIPTPLSVEFRVNRGYFKLYFQNVRQPAKIHCLLDFLISVFLEKFEKFP